MNTNNITLSNKVNKEYQTLTRVQNIGDVMSQYFQAKWTDLGKSYTNPILYSDMDRSDLRDLNGLTSDAINYPEAFDCYTLTEVL